jgi:hypothetical protein
MEVNSHPEGFISKNLTGLFFKSSTHSHSIPYDGHPVEEDIDAVRVYPSPRMADGA